MLRRRQRLSMLPVAAVVALAPGCREELGPERFPTVSVQGVVLQAGDPVPSGWIEFQPADGTVGDIRSARIEPDGRFRADRVAIGLNVIRLVDLPGIPPGAVPALSFQSTIRRSIPSQPGGPIRVDVYDELVRHQNAKAPTSRSDSREGEPRP